MHNRATRFVANNAIALLALFLALGGASYAASGALTSSTPQYKACVGESHVVVLKTGHRPCGQGKKTIVWNQQGPAGAAGAKGATGAAGAPGAPGAPGVSALSTLPSGASESGEYNVGTGDSKLEYINDAHSFAIPLAAPLDGSHVQYVPGGSTPNCPGTGQAARGFLCVYSHTEEGLAPADIYSHETSSTPVPGTGRFGFDLQWTVLLQEGFDSGSWTVTAP